MVVSRRWGFTLDSPAPPQKLKNRPRIPNLFRFVVASDCRPTPKTGSVALTAMFHARSPFVRAVNGIVVDSSANVDFA